MDEVFDFVVAGNGGGSMCAALVMANAGKNTLILEKTDKAGGTTAMSGGVMWVPNNRFMKEAGVEDSFEKAMTYLDAVVGDDPGAPGATRERRAAYVTQAPRMVDFLVDNGIKLMRMPFWPDYYDEKPGSSAPGRTVTARLFDANELGSWKDALAPNFMPVVAMHNEGFELGTFKRSIKGKLMMAKVIGRMALAKLTGKSLVPAGNALQGRMLQAALKAGVEIRTCSPVDELIVENGRVTGVRTMRDGKEWRIGARLGVLLNAGGFSRNQEMRDKYIPHTRAEWTNTGPGDTGEIIREAQRIGAAIAQMSARVGNQMTLPPGSLEAKFRPMIQMELAKPHAILVDQTGERFQNEAGSYSAFCKGMLERHEQRKAIPSYMIIDSQFIRNYMLSSSMPGEKKPQAWFDSGFLKKADTIEELAGLLKIDPATLRATVDRWNGFVGQKKDADFGRGDREYDRWLGDKYDAHHPTLGTIEQGPFYAVEIYPGDVGTYGGVVTDTKARVLREDGTEIEGLYATGTTTASVFGQSYPGAGASIGPSFTWGYVAARHAAGLDNQA